MFNLFKNKYVIKSLCRVRSKFVFFSKNGITPVVAMALLLVVSVISVVGFQGWFTNFTGFLLVGVETQSSSSFGGGADVDGIYGNTLYIRSNGNVGGKINSVSVNEVDCNISENLTSNSINKIDLSYCLANVDSGVADILVVIDSKIIEKTQMVDLSGLYFAKSEYPYIIFNEVSIPRALFGAVDANTNITFRVKETGENVTITLSQFSYDLGGGVMYNFNSLFSSDIRGKVVEIVNVDYSKISAIRFLPATKVIDFQLNDEFTGLETLNLNGKGLLNFNIYSNWTSLRYLGLNYNNINSFTGYDSWTELTQLHLANNNLNSFTGSNYWTKLNQLNLGSNNLNSFSSLNLWNNLTNLYLEYNNLDSVDLNEDWVNLTVLSISGNQNLNSLDISNNWTNLQSLDLLDTNLPCFKYNFTFPVDLTIFQDDDSCNLPNYVEDTLIYFDTGSNYVDSFVFGIKPFTGLNTNVTVEVLETGKTASHFYDVHDNFDFNLTEDLRRKTVKISFENPENVEQISTWGNNFKSIEGFEGLVNLSNLLLEDNDIEEISFQHSLPKLSRLNIGDNKLTGFDVNFNNINSVVHLDLDVNRIKFVNFTNTLSNIHTLNIQKNYNYVENIVLDPNWTTLTYLYMKYNYNLDNFTIYPDWGSIEQLFLDYMQLENLYGLENLNGNLTSFYVNNNNLDEFTGSSNWTSLSIIDVSNNDFNYCVPKDPAWTPGVTFTQTNSSCVS